MPVTSSVIPCPAGQWTSIAPYLETRRTLIVQCPQVRDAAGHGNVVIPSKTVQSFAAANNLRTKLIVTSPTLGFDVWVAPVNTVSPTTGFKIQTATLGEAITPILEVDDSWGVDCLGAWYAWNDAATPTTIYFVEVEPECPAIILGMTQAVPIQIANLGNIPIGIWQGADLSSGGSQFRLNADQDGELVQQQWFAWNPGNFDVDIQVLQTFDLPPERSALVVQLPSLSPHGKLAAWELLKAMRPKVDEDVGLPDDQEF